MTRLSKIKSIFLLFFCLTFQPIFSEVIQDADFGFFLDIPEGYEIANYSNDGLSYIFEHPNIPVTFAMKIYKNDSHKTNNEDVTKNVLKYALSNLSAKYDIDTFDWYGNKCSISNFDFNLDKSYSGWSVCTPTNNEKYNLVLLCYAPKEKFAGCEQFIISTINSLSLSAEKINIPGIIVSYAFPPTKKQPIKLQIANKQINSFIYDNDIEAAQFVVDLEYSVLSLYSKHEKWKEAWERYYRMIYKDSYSRILQVSADIYKALEPEANKAQNPLIDYAQMLLTWVQNFPYNRAKDVKESDFTCIPAVISGQGSDCDSRSMLICILLKSLGIETVLYFSPEYSHALVATEIEAPGQTFSIKTSSGEAIKFLIGETTAKVTWGMIAKDMTDESKWIPVIFPF